MKATDLLRTQHREVLTLLRRVCRNDDAHVPDLLERIAESLRVHTRLEEELFYPAVRRAGTASVDDMILEAIEEHHVVDLVLEELPAADPEAESFRAKMTVLKELVEHHVEEEQNEMFPLAEKKLSRRKLMELGEEMEARAGEIAAELTGSQTGSGPPRGASSGGTERRASDHGLARRDPQMPTTKRSARGKRKTAASARGRRYGPKAAEKVEKAMHERKRGTLRSGRSGKKVTSRAQAIAIGLSQARRAGAKVPRETDA